MAEIAICVVDITNPASVYLNTKLPKRGDVLCVVEDGHVWGSSELGQDNWRIIQLPGVPVAALDALLTAEVATSPPGQKGAPNTLQFRGFYLDLDHAALPAAPENLARRSDAEGREVPERAERRNRDRAARGDQKAAPGRR